jgi:ribosomal protein L30E
MQTLYDSETYTVTHMLANAEADGKTAVGERKTVQYPGGVPLLARHGFEIVDKRAGKEVYLDGSWAELFQQHIVAWQVNTPTQEEVEDTLEGYAELAQTPVLVH